MSSTPRPQPVLEQAKCEQEKEEETWCPRFVSSAGPGDLNLPPKPPSKLPLPPSSAKLGLEPAVPRPLQNVPEANHHCGFHGLLFTLRQPQMHQPHNMVARLPGRVCLPELQLRPSLGGLPVQEALLLLSPVTPGHSQGSLHSPLWDKLGSQCL